eukprot:PLAT4306.1.p1 GENE.PLAT4306.1~~PLAT4306.1.p1  ORF type:complete len:237 (+),score=70.56 PLAT4306.1:82-711(+)
MTAGRLLSASKSFRREEVKEDAAAAPVGGRLCGQCLRFSCPAVPFEEGRQAARSRLWEQLLALKRCQTVSSDRLPLLAQELEEAAAARAYTACEFEHELARLARQEVEAAHSVCWSTLARLRDTYGTQLEWMLQSVQRKVIEFRSPSLCRTAMKLKRWQMELQARRRTAWTPPPPLPRLHKLERQLHRLFQATQARKEQQRRLRCSVTL